MKDAKESALIKELSHKQVRKHLADLASPGSGLATAWFPLSAGAIFLLAGANTLFDVFDKAQVWSLDEPLSGVSWRYLMVLACLVELLAAWICLFTDKINLRMGIVASLTMDFLVYRIGLWYMDWHHPWIFVGGMRDAWNISPLLADQIITAITLYLLVGSTILLFLPQKRPEAMAKEADLYKTYCPSCAEKATFTVERIEQTIACSRCGSALLLNKPS